ncbi:unnamed protein product, partial [Bubo scandiacus]
KWLLICDRHTRMPQIKNFGSPFSKGPGYSLWDSNMISRLLFMLQLLTCIEKLIRLSLAKLDDE